MIEDIIKKLAIKIEENPERYYFKKGVSKEEIEKVENALNIKIPESYKTFLMNYNGGFICDKEYFEYQKSKDMNIEEGSYPKFLSLQEIIEEYNLMRKIEQDRGFQGHWPFIPFYKTENNDLVIFKNPLIYNESPVFDANHEISPKDWHVVYKSFEEMLSKYIVNESDISTVGSYKNPTAMTKEEEERSYK